MIRGACLAALAALALAAPVVSRAGVIPSKAEDGSAASDRAADLEKVRTTLARQEVGVALVRHGLSPAEAEQRLAQLSDQDLRSLATHIDQVQAAGEVPKYIWILLGIFLAVSIILAIA
jgi:hypothetical protein